MAKEPNTQQGTFVINNNSKPATLDGVCRAYFGKSLERLVTDIKKNAGGQYDHLYT